MGEVTEVHVDKIVVCVDFEGVDCRIFCSNFCGCERFLKVYTFKKGGRCCDMWMCTGDFSG